MISLPELAGTTSALLDRMRISLLLPLVTTALVALPACVTTEEPTESSDDAVSLRGPGAGELIRIAGICKRQPESSPRGDEIIGTRLKQKGPKVVAEFSRQFFGEFFVELGADGTGKTSVSKPNRTLHMQVTLKGGTLSVATRETDTVGGVTYTERCRYSGPTRLSISARNPPTDAPRFPPGRISAGGLCMGEKNGRLRMQACTAESPFWTFAWNEQLSSNGKCVGLGAIGGAGYRYPYLGVACPGTPVGFYANRIASGRLCLPTYVRDTPSNPRVTGDRMVECSAREGGSGAWDFREDGSIVSLGSHALGLSDCLVVADDQPRIDSCAYGTKWNLLPAGRIRQAGTNDCLIPGDRGRLELASCDAIPSGVEPWRLEGKMGRDSTTFSLPQIGVVGEAVEVGYGDSDWSFIF